MILGMEIERDRVKGRLKLIQMSYLQKMLKKFSFDGNAKVMSTPLDHHFKISAKMSHVSVEDREYMSKVLYANTVGSLILQRYIKDTVDVGLVFEKNGRNG
ncbi:uncharacterized protein LOC109828076 [Asparagus officinalis]|uniref:uncharacterized protein LOC109828076 n=1 Tax=Asparagus officinalis TaxID=4686 RepID=UPI00098E34EF|nr:uncharacterized protein LOC109828076 [Asparagus officinalis]